MVTREDLAGQLGALALVLFPDGMEAHELSLEDLEGARLRTIKIFDEAGDQVRRDAQHAADLALSPQVCTGCRKVVTLPREDESGLCASCWTEREIASYDEDDEADMRYQQALDEVGRD